MLRIFKWMLRMFVGLMVLIAAALIGVYWLASRSLPDYSASHVLEGIRNPVEIVRDNANVPHIFGDDDQDVFFGLGFAHAQDRLWQMTMLRRTAQGRLSEIFGESTLATDDLLRRLGFQKAANASLEALEPETRVALEAYSRGVNAWLEVVNSESLGRGAPEFFMFPPRIAPWQPADSLAVGKVMALQLSGHLDEEVLRRRMSLILPDARLRDILPEAPGLGVAALSDTAGLPLPPEPRHASAGASRPTPFLWPTRPRGLTGASNAWAAAPERSTSSSTLLANDPHLMLTAPTIWYLSRLELSTGAVIGGTIPGIPVILVGRSESLGWGLTHAYADNQDLFLEEVNPESVEEYRSGGEWVPFETERSVIRVKDAPPVTITLRSTRNGPVLPGGHYNLSTVTPRGHVISLGWPALSRRDTTADGMLGIMRSGSIRQAIAAGEKVVAPVQNLTLADRDGVALQVIGAVPARHPNHQTMGRVPAPGWRAVNRWRGRLPYSSNPRFLNPPGGIVGNTNNKIVNRGFPRHLSFVWGDTQRVQRWTRLMRNREVHTRESFIEAQLDTVSVAARTILPLIARDLWRRDATAEAGTLEGRRKAALDLLAEWNGEMNEHLPEPLIYAAWLRTLQDWLIRDEIGGLVTEFRHADPIFIERVFRNVDGASAWCDVMQSTVKENCTDIARGSLDAALTRLTENWGENIESWRWGDVHQARHDHQVLGETPILKWIVNIRQSTSGGDHTLQRGRTAGAGGNPFANVHSAGYRGVYDFADPDSSVFITSTGQSGHPLSRHYDDLGELWRRGEYIPMSLDPDLARAANVGVTHLIPAGGHSAEASR